MLRASPGNQAGQTRGESRLTPSPQRSDRWTMKRFHLHISVNNLDESIRFYSTLFAAQPTVLQSDGFVQVVDADV